jgi:CheY-like chemotaxis protein
MKKILVVDDDESILQVVDIVLRDAGYQVAIVSDQKGLEAQLSSKLPDAMLVDIFVGSLDGREICRAIKANPQTQHIPVILMSADTQIHEKSESAGADNYIEKPFDIDDLVNLISRHVAREKKSLHAIPT